MSNENEEKTVGEIVLENEWLIRSCDVYDEEYKDCRGIKSRFHQYFVHGKTEDCTQWKRDLDNCYKWTEKKDVKAAKELIESEQQRRFNRLKAHYGNNIWEKRKSPPDDWNKPLPDYLIKEYENTYLHLKNKEMKGEIEPTIESKCSVM